MKGPMLAAFLAVLVLQIGVLGWSCYRAGYHAAQADCAIKEQP